MKSTPSPPRTPMKSFSGGRTSSRFFGPRTLESVEEASQCTAVANSPAPESPDSDATVTPLAHSVPLPGSRNNGSSQSFSPKNDVFSGSSSIADTISAVSLPDPFTTPRSTSYPSTDEQRPLYFPSLIGTAPFTATQPFRLCPTTSHLNMRTPALDPATSSRLDMRIPTSGPSTSSSLPGLAQRSAPAPSYPTAQAPLSLQGQHKLAREKWIRDSAREIALLAQKVKACQAKYLVTSKLADYQEYMHAREQFMQATSLERRLEQRRQIGLPPGMKPLRTGAGNLPGDGFQGLGFQGLGQEGGSEVGDGSGKLLGYRMALMEKTCGQVYKPEYSSNHDTNGTCIPTSSSSPTHTTTQPRTKYTFPSTPPHPPSNTQRFRTLQQHKEAYEKLEQGRADLMKLACLQIDRIPEEIDGLAEEVRKQLSEEEERNAKRKKMMEEIEGMMERKLEKKLERQKEEKLKEAEEEEADEEG